MKKLFLLSILFFFSTLFRGVCQEPTLADLDDIGHKGMIGSGHSFDDILHKSLSTGSLNINIPFYKYSNNNVDLSVGISYNTSGIQVDRLSSDVGMGWEFFTGGMITRQIRGRFEDEHDGSINTSAPFDKGFWFGDATYRSDSECDIFYLTFGNRSIKFMFDYTGQLVTIPSTKVQIERYIGGSISGGIPNYFLFLVSGVMTINHAFPSEFSFKVTDEFGNVFKFIKSKWSNANVVSEWCLDRVETYEGQTIYYHYITDQRWDNQKLSQTFQEKNQNYGAVYNSMTTSNLNYRYIDTIVYPNGIRVNFVYNAFGRYDIQGSGGHSLKKIEITEDNIAQVFSYPSVAPRISHSFNFVQSYFVSPFKGMGPGGAPIITSDYTTWQSSGVHQNWTPMGSFSSAYPYWYQYRLKLDGIIAVGTDGSSKNLFSFDYSTVPIANYMIGVRDKYGYTNGKPINTFASTAWYSGCGPYDLYIPFHYINPTASALPVGIDQSVSSNELFTSAGVLNKIVNDKGGVIELAYHNMQHYLKDDGGIVIDKITKSDGYNPDNTTITKYYFTDYERFANDGQPIIFTADEYDYAPVGTCIASSGKFPWTNYLQGANLLNTALNGPRSCFKTVQEYYYDKLYNPLGGTFYTYSGMTPDASSGISSNSIYSFGGSAPYTNKQYIREWGLGVLLSTKSFDKNYNTTNLTEYTYSIFHSLSSTDNYHSFYYVNDAGGASARLPIPPDLYHPVTGKLLLTKTHIKNYYSNTGYTESITNYTYDGSPYYNLIATDFNNSKGENITSHNYYNYSWPTSTSTNAAITKMISDGVMALLYSDKCKNTSTGNKLINLQISGPTIVGGNIIRPTFLYSLAPPIASSAFIGYPFYADMASIATGASASNLQLNGGVTKFDDKGFSIEQTDLAGVGNNTFTSKIINNVTGEVIAEAQNAKYDEIAYCNFECDYGYLYVFTYFPAAGSAPPYNAYVPHGSVYNLGNVNFSQVKLTSSYSLTGRYSLQYSNSMPLTTSNTLVSGKKYKISLWVTSGSPLNATYNVPGGTAAISLSIQGTYVIPGSGVTWNLFTGTFTSAGLGGVTISGNGFLDDFKLYPANAMIVTHDYVPLIGKVADVDINDRITTYEYDGFGNLTITRDQNGNIISKVKTIIQGH